jgi:hypothetical protein
MTTKTAIGLSDIGGQIAGMYQSIPEDVRATALRGLLGAGAGAGALGLTHALTPRDPDEESHLGRRMALGALAGGGLAAAAPLGKDLLTGAKRFMDEQGRGPLEALLGKTVGAAGSQFGALAGGGLAARLGWGRWGNMLPTEGALYRTLGGLNGTKPNLFKFAPPDPSAIANWRTRFQSLGVTTPNDIKMLLQKTQALGADPAAYKAEIRRLLSSVHAPVQYQGVGDFFSSRSVKNPALLRTLVARVSAALGRTPYRMPASRMVPVLRNSLGQTLKSVKDPRLKLIGSILAGVAGGSAIHGAFKGSM